MRGTRDNETILNSYRSAHLVLVVTQKNTLGGGGLKVKNKKVIMIWG
jgi:hypothetical protein